MRFVRSRSRTLIVPAYTGFHRALGFFGHVTIGLDAHATQTVSGGVKKGLEMYRVGCRFSV